jgi:hypothetical protein
MSNSTCASGDYDMRLTYTLKFIVCLTGNTVRVCLHNKYISINFLYGNNPCLF